MKLTKSSLYSSSSLYTGIIAGLVLAVSGLGAKNAMANPAGGTSVTGNTTTTTSGNTETITQTGGPAIINWQSFSIASGEITKFIQPSSNSIILNRVTGGSISEILGTLDANGHIILINPNGVFFGKGSQVNVAGMIASTANISDQNFLAHNYKFDQASTVAGASIINEGRITAHDAGLIALVAPSVTNSGIIRAKEGTVILGGGKTFTLDLYGDNLYSFAINTPSSGNGTNSALVTNSGLISATGGNVLLTARAAGSVVNDVINNSGIIEATTSHKGKNGSIVLDGGDGNVTNSGTLNASGTGAGQTGGKVTVEGNNVTLTSTSDIDVTGNAGGGSATVTAANVLEMAAGSVIDASALQTGNGGTVSLWGNTLTDFFGTIFARGGAVSGNGGSVETSGNELDAEGVVDASAANGNAGTWLMDPYNVTIVNTGGTNLPGNNFTAGGTSVISASSIDNALTNGTTVTISTNGLGSGSDAGDINVNASILDTKTGTASLILKAFRDVILGSGVEIGATGTANKLNVTLDADTGNAGGYVLLNSGSSIVTGGGNIVLGGGNNPATGAAVSNDPNVGGVELAGATLDATGKTGNGGNITVNGTANAGNTYYDGIDLLSGSTIKTNGNGSITLTGNGSAGSSTGNDSVGVYVEGSTVSAQNGTITITGTGHGTGVTPDYGVALDGANITTTSGHGNIKIVGTGANGAAGIISGAGLYAASTIASGDNLTLDTGSSSIDFGGSTLSAAGDVSVTAGDVTLSNTFITAGNDLDINNSGVFSSNTAQVLKGKTVELNQNLPGSIQNAINAINPSAITSTLTLGNGIWDQTFAINNFSNIFNLDGSGEWNGTTGTLIQPTSLASVTGIDDNQPHSMLYYFPIVTIANDKTVNVSNLSVDGSKAGSPPAVPGAQSYEAGIVYQNAGGTVNKVAVSEAGAYGILAVDVSMYGDTLHTVNIDDSTVSGENSAAMAATGDDIIFNVTDSVLDGRGGAQGMDYSLDSRGTFLDNTVYTGTGNSFDRNVGIDFHGADGVTILGGTIIGNGAGSIGIADNGYAYTGYGAASNITIFGENISNVGIGVQVNGGSEWSITGSTITGTGNGTGIGVDFVETTDSNVGSIGLFGGNTITNFGTGVSVDPSSGISVVANTIDNVGTGVTVSGLTGTNTISGNTIYDASADAIDVADTAAGLTVAFNNIGTHGGADNVRGTGIFSTDSDNVMIDDNYITNTFSTGDQIGSGVYLLGDSGDTVKNNLITNVNWDGIKIEGGNNFNVTGNVIDGTTRVGIWVNGVSTASITNNNVSHDALAGYGAIDINGGSNMTITGNTVDNADYGILLSGVSGTNLVQNNNTSSVNNDGIYADSVSGLTIDQNTVNGNVVGINVIDSDGVSITGNTVSNATTGISVDPSSNVTITGNDVFSAATGITVDGGSNLNVSNNTLGIDTTPKNHSKNTGITGDGIDVTDVGGTVNVNKNSITGASNNTGSGISVDGLNGTTTVGKFNNGNTITGFEKAGVAIKDSSNVTADYNIISHITDAGMTVVDSNHITLDNNNVSYANAGIAVDPSSYITIDDNTIDNTNVAGVSVWGGDHTTVDGNTITNAGDYGVYGESTSHLEVDGNTITNAFDGVFVGGINGSSDYVQIDNNKVNNTVAGIQVIGDTFGGPAGYDLEIDHNTVNGAVYGIEAAFYDGVTVNDNTVTGINGFDSNGILLAYDKYATVDGNTVSDSATYGINVDDSSDITVSNNDVNNVVTGINVDDSSDITITGNDIYSATTGINSKGGKNITISYNTLGEDLHNKSAHDGITGDGIVVADNTGDVTIIGNSLTAAHGNSHTGISLTNDSGTNVIGAADTTYGFGKHKVTVDNGNDVTGFATGISVIGNSHGHNKTTIDNNDVSAFSKAGIYTDNVHDLTVTNNNVGDPGTYGIEVIGSDYAQIDHNDVYDVTTGIYVDGGYGNTVDGNTISNTSTGISVNHSNDIRIDGNIINFTGTGINVDGSDYAQIDWNYITNAYDGIDVDGGKDVTVDANYISADHHSNDGIELSNVGGHNSVDGNTVDGFHNDGISLYRTSDSSVDGNHLNYDNTGISLDQSDSDKVEGNHINGGNTGISLDDSNFIKVAYNHIKNVVTGIFADPSSHLDISNNFIDGAQTGINIIGGSHDQIDGNQIEHVQTGIKTQYANDLRIDGNDISHAGTGIEVENGSDIKVDYNYISNVGTAIEANDVSDVQIDGNHIRHAHTGVDVVFANDVQADDNHISHVGTGIKFAGVTNSQADGNDISHAGTGIDVTDYVKGHVHYSSNISLDGNNIDHVGTGVNVNDGSNDIRIDGNTISHAGTAINVDGSYNVTIDHNHIADVINGIEASDDDNLTVDHNHLRDVADEGIFVYDDTGHTRINDNTIRHDNGPAIETLDTDHVTIDGNTISHAESGIAVVNGDHASIEGNDLYHIATTGISVDPSSFVTISDNFIDGAHTGIDVNGGSHYTIDDNNIENVQDGISVDHVHDLDLSGNDIMAGHHSHDGIDLSDDSGVITLSNNIVDGFAKVGINVNHTNNVQFASNQVTGVPGTVTVDFATDSFSVSGGSIGVLLTDSNGATFNGDSVINNNTGIELSGSSNTTITGVKFTDNNIGLFAHDDSHGHGSVNTQVATSTFTNTAVGSIGIALDGPNTKTFSFVNGTTSFFTGQTLYFALSDGAADGQIIWAYNQQFGGVLGEDFTFGEYNTAEGQTYDLHFASANAAFANVGLVCYNTTCTAPANPNAFDHENVFLLQNEGSPEDPKLSFAGQTIAPVVPGGSGINNPTPVNPTSFSVSGVSLSLLAPAAGGDNGDSGAIQDLSPAAGGDTSKYASLSPSAGGDGDCGNSFLGTGFALNYNSGGCHKE